MNKILFGIVGWNIAETTRMIEVAKIFKNDYECHFFSYGGQFEHLVTDEGFILHNLTPIEDDAKIQLLWKIDRGETFKEPWTYDELKERVKNEIALINELKPAFAFLGSVLTFSLSCNITNTKLFNLIPISMSRPYLESVQSINPYLPKYINKIICWTALNIPLLMKNFNKIAKEYGLKKRSNLLELWEGDINIVADIKELSLLKTLPQNWYYSGALFAHLNTDIPANVLNILNNSTKKKVYFAMGSSANRDILLKALSAFQDIDVTVIAPIKSHLKPNDNIPSNVIVTDWLPALEVTKMVDVAVIHGGQGTVQTTVLAGVPFVGIGMQPEQDMNIYVYKQFGNALQIRKSKVSKQSIKTNIEKLLNEKQYKIQAKKAMDIVVNVDTKKIIKEIVNNNIT
ncbi:MAG: glycosyltransferase [Clostridium sp.]|uniref:glycosyltransferase n=1 Tax=Clostridium sp. TaxID=1506 RepID=UPI0030639F53